MDHQDIALHSISPFIVFITNHIDIVDIVIALFAVVLAHVIAMLTFEIGLLLSLPL